MDLSRIFWGWGNREAHGTPKPLEATPVTTEPRAEDTPEESSSSSAPVTSLSRLELTKNDLDIINSHLDRTLPAYIQAYLDADPTALAKANLAIIRPIKTLGLSPDLPLDFLMYSLLEEQVERLATRPETPQIVTNLDAIYQQRFLTDDENTALDALDLKDQLNLIADRYITPPPPIEDIDDELDDPIARVQTPLYLNLIELLDRSNLSADQETIAMKYIGQKIMEMMFPDDN